MFTRRLFQVVAAGILTATVPGVARSQDALERAKTLYLEAAYEDALALLDTRFGRDRRHALVPGALPVGTGADYGSRRRHCQIDRG